MHGLLLCVILAFTKQATSEKQCKEDIINVYWDIGNCGPDGDDANWHLCGWTRGYCPPEVQTDLCASGRATRKWSKGHDIKGCCHYHWSAQYVCTEIPDAKPCINAIIKIKAEFSEHSAVSSSNKITIITSSDVYNKIAGTVSNTFETNFGAFELFNVGLKTIFLESFEETSHVKTRKEIVEENSITFKPEFLQIRQKITKTIVLNGYSASVEEKEIIDA